MEANNNGGVQGAETGWEAWDAVPRDGPAVFVINTEVLDRQGRIEGRWIDLSGGQGAMETALEDLLGGENPDNASWAIVDQVGLGPRMAPETWPADQLHQLPAALASEDGM